MEIYLKIGKIAVGNLYTKSVRGRNETCTCDYDCTIENYLERTYKFIC